MTNLEKNLHESKTASACLHALGYSYHRAWLWANGDAVVRVHMDYDPGTHRYYHTIDGMSGQFNTGPSCALAYALMLEAKR